MVSTQKKFAQCRQEFGLPRQKVFTNCFFTSTSPHFQYVAHTSPFLDSGSETIRVNCGADRNLSPKPRNDAFQGRPGSIPVVRTHHENLAFQSFSGGSKGGGRRDFWPLLCFNDQPSVMSNPPLHLQCHFSVSPFFFLYQQLKKIIIGELKHCSTAVRYPSMTAHSNCNQAYLFAGAPIPTAYLYLEKNTLRGPPLSFSSISFSTHTLHIIFLPTLFIPR